PLRGPGGGAMTSVGAAHMLSREPGAAARLRDYLYANPAVVRGLLIVAALIAWEVVARLFVDPDFLSPPSSIVHAIPRVLGDPKVLLALADTFYELVAGFGLAVVIGLAIAVPIGLNRVALRSGLPLILLLYSIPQVTI